MTYEEILSLTIRPADALIKIRDRTGDPTEQNAAASAAGEPESETGLVYQDEFLTVVRDAVSFADGDHGTYLRAFEHPIGSDAVAILPRCGSRFVLVKHWRHATNRWHIEVPRGMGGQSAETQARQEIREELGVEATSMVSLGHVYANNGLLTTRTKLFACDVCGPYSVDTREGIAGVEVFTRNELMEAVSQGDIDDSFTLACVLREQLVQP